MKEGNIVYREYGDEAGSPIEKLVHAFVHGDSVSQEDIRTSAANIATDLAPVLEAARTPDEGATIILSAVDTLKMSNQIRREYLYEKGGELDELGSAILQYDSNDKFEQEIERHLAPIREGLLRELAPLVPGHANNTWIQGKALNRSNVHILHGSGKKAILKQASDLEEREEREDRIDALRHLYSLPGDRNPYIAYSILQVTNRVGGPGEPDQIQYHRRFDTLEDILDAEQQTPLGDVIGLVRDGLRGATFLVENGLRLTDLGPHNIARDSVTGRGMLFDFDYLRLADAPLASDRSYSAPAPFTPPEREYDTEGEPVAESQMVYEFGETLKRIAAGYQESDPDMCNRLIEVAKRMKDTDPNVRPTLQDSAEELDSFLGLLSVPAA